MSASYTIIRPENRYASRLPNLRDATGRELARVPVRPDDIVGL